jgi:hypothetical protein
MKPGQVLALVEAPAGWTVEDLPEGARIRRGLRSGAETVLVFLHRAADLDRLLPGVIGVVLAEDALWLAWPRRAAGHDSDITDEVLRERVLPSGLVDVKVAALGEDWSGLRFVWRKELRAGLPRR